MKKILTILCIGSIISGQHFAATTAEPANPPVSWDFQTAPDDITIVNNEDGTPTFEYVSWKRCMGYDASYGDSAVSDMIVLPPIALAAGKNYELTYSANASWYRFDWDPTLKWEIARTDDANAARTDLGEAVTFTSSYDAESHSLNFSVSEDGIYTIDALFTAGEAQGSGSFYIYSINIGAGVSANAPAEPVLTVTPSISQGALQMNISLIAPAKTIGGADLSGKLNYKISNADGRYDVTGEIMPGESIDLTDNACNPSGETYTAFVFTSEETGKSVSATCTPEYDRPSAPQNVKISQEGKSTVTVEWDPVTTGATGGLFNPATVVYSVMRSDRTYVATKISETSITDTPELPEQGQAAFSYTVYAYPDSQSYYSASTETEEIILGDAYRGGLAESFDNGDSTTSIWSFGPAGASNSAWSPSTSSYSNPSCHDDSDSTGGFLLFNPSYTDGIEYLSPVIDMSGSTNPHLSLDVYRYSAAPDATLVTLWAEADGTRTPVENGEINFHADADGWTSLDFLLPDAVKTGTFRILFAGNKVDGVAYKAIVDNIVIRDIKATDAALESVSIAKESMPGQTIDVTAKVCNQGALPLDNVCVAVEMDSEEAARSEYFSLQPGEKKELTLSIYITPFMAEAEHGMTVKVNAEGDLDETNNSISENISVGSHSLNCGSIVSAEHTKDGAVIRWAAPETDDQPAAVPVSESFESWTVGDTSARDGWIFVDADGKAKYGLAGVNEDKEYAFFVADKFSSSAVATLTAADGEKALVTSRAADYSSTDVWLISPEIGAGSEVSFQATGLGFRGAAATSFEFGYLPAGSENSADFVKISDMETSGYSWETFTETMPAEASRFAIHVADVSDYGAAFDDFNFVKLTVPPTLKNFRIWRDRKPVATLNAEESEWTDATVDPKTDHRYHLSCIYDPDKEVVEPEGMLLAAYDPTLGVDNMESEEGWRIDNNIITARVNLEIYDLSGVRIATAKASESILLLPGSYIIKAAEKHTKLIVK